MHRNALFVCLALMTATPAALANRSRHERVEISPVKAKGEVVGLKVKMLLRPTDTGHDRVRVSLVPVGAFNTKEMNTGDAFRSHAAGLSSGVALHMFKEIDGLKTNEAKEVTFQVKFSEAPGLKPGTEFEVVSAWNSKANIDKAGWWHVWGASSSMNAKGDSYKAPGAAAARVTHIKNVKRQSSKQPARSRAPRAPAKTAKAKPRARGRR